MVRPKAETAKNICGLFAFILKAASRAASRLHVHENTDEGVA